MCQVQGKQHPGSQHACLNLYAPALYEGTEGVCCLACCMSLFFHTYMRGLNL